MLDHAFQRRLPDITREGDFAFDDVFRISLETVEHCDAALAIARYRFEFEREIHGGDIAFKAKGLGSVGASEDALEAVCTSIVCEGPFKWLRVTIKCARAFDDEAVVTFRVASPFLFDRDDVVVFAFKFTGGFPGAYKMFKDLMRG